MSTLYTEQSKNVTKTWFLMAIFLAIVIGIGYFLIFFYNSSGFLYIAIIISVVMNITSYWYSDKIVLSLNKAKEANREDYFDLYNSVENLSITAGLPMPKVYIIEDASPNAFATGGNKEHAVVCVTTGLLNLREFYLMSFRILGIVIFCFRQLLLCLLDLFQYLRTCLPAVCFLVVEIKKKKTAE